MTVESGKLVAPQPHYYKNKVTASTGYPPSLGSAVSASMATDVMELAEGTTCREAWAKQASASSAPGAPEPNHVRSDAEAQAESRLHTRAAAHAEQAGEAPQLASRRRWLLPLLLVALMLLLASLWQWTPLAQFANPDYLRSLQAKVKSTEWAALAVVPAYVSASFMMFPNMALDVATILTFGGFKGWALANLGSLCAASLFFYLGRRFGGSSVKHLRSSGIAKIRNVMRRGGIGSVIAVRLVPIAPFPVVNLIAGAMGIRYVHFITGTFLAMAPGTITLAIFGRQLQRVFANPDKQNIALSVTIVLVGFALLYLIRRWAQRQTITDGNEQ